MTSSTYRTRLRARLAEARRTRDRELTAVLRSALGALENAEAVPADVDTPPSTSEHIAGAHAGLGAAEAPRRTLSEPEELQILSAEVAELRRAADQYAAGGRPEAARRALESADTLEGLLEL